MTYEEEIAEIRQRQNQYIGSSSADAMFEIAIQVAKFRHALCFCLCNSATVSNCSREEKKLTRIDRRLKEVQQDFPRRLVYGCWVHRVAEYSDARTLPELIKWADSDAPLDIHTVGPVVLKKFREHLRRFWQTTDVQHGKERNARR